MKKQDIEKLKEVWADVRGYEGVYQVSNMGNVKSIERTIPHPKNGFRKLKSKSLSKINHCKGYFRVCLNYNGIQKMFFIHRLVCDAFLDNPEQKDQVNHKNGNKTDNRLSNLEWSTSSENMRHADHLGLRKNHGEYNKASKLSSKKVKEIKLMANKYTQKQIACFFGVNQTTIGRVINLKSWNTKTH